MVSNTIVRHLGVEYPLPSLNQDSPSIFQTAPTIPPAPNTHGGQQLNCEEAVEGGNCYPRRKSETSALFEADFQSASLRENKIAAEMNTIQ